MTERPGPSGDSGMPAADARTGTGAAARVSVGRAVQSRVYRDGVYGRRRAVPVNPDALERAAERAASARAWAYINGSAGRETTARANRAALDRRRIAPRMLTGVAERDLGIELFGRALPSPFLLAPIGVLGMVSREKDLPVARAAAATGTPMVVSTQASVPMERIAEAMGDACRWYQLYWSSDAELAASMVARAERSGCSALVVTLDTHVLGWRTRDLDLGFLPFAHGQGIAQYTSDPVFQELVRRRAARPSAGPAPRPTPAAIRALMSIARHHPGGLRRNLRSPLPRAAVETFLDVFSNSALTWDDLAFLRERTRLPILLKGIQRRDDAARALDRGVDGIVVSNHGGRQVDGAIGALDALPGIAAEVAGRVPIVFDSGVRSGADAFKALALGATAVGIGRPYVYGLAIAGERGVRAVIEHMVAELDITMALAGCARIADIRPELLDDRVHGVAG